MAERVMPDKRPAPELLVVFECPKCKARTILDAYNGPATCTGLADAPHTPTFCKAIALQRDTPINPLADIDAMRTQERTW